MFEVCTGDIDIILNEFGISAGIISTKELCRYHYEADSPDSKEVRLIIKADLRDNSSVVIRFKNESDVTLDLIESQNLFAERLRYNGIATPYIYKTDGKTAKRYLINGYDVIVSVEEFVEGEIKRVDKNIAESTGALLAATHNISESNDCHVNYPVLFDPFTGNDLFSYDDFLSVGKGLPDGYKTVYERIIAEYNRHMDALGQLKREKKYAVQGDISDCNLYMTENGIVGLFDYNRCGDNNLYCDAIMQAIFEARLMDYPPDYGSDTEEVILKAFLNGYNRVRPFTDAQIELFPHLYAVVNAFWSSDIVYNENSLINMYDKNNLPEVYKILKSTERKIVETKAMPLF